MRNPGVTGVLITRSFKPFSDGRGGVLIRMGVPEDIEWYAERGRATRKQVMDSIESGLSLLVDECNKEETQQDRDSAHRQLTAQVSETMRWLPPEPPPVASSANPWTPPVAE
jgi:hypothetical protein